MHIYLFSTDES